MSVFDVLHEETTWQNPTVANSFKRIATSGIHLTSCGTLDNGLLKVVSKATVFAICIDARIIIVSGLAFYQYVAITVHKIYINSPLYPFLSSNSFTQVNMQVPYPSFKTLGPIPDQCLNPQGG